MAILYKLYLTEITRKLSLLKLTQYNNYYTGAWLASIYYIHSNYIISLLFFSFNWWKFLENITMSNSNILCILYSDNILEILHTWKCNHIRQEIRWYQARATWHLTPRGNCIFSGTCATKRYFIRCGVHFLLFCSQPHNLFLERPVIMSVRNAALLYATRGYRCRVAREIFSGISEQKRNAREIALWYRRVASTVLYYTHNNSHSDHEITWQCVQSVSIRRDNDYYHAS